jgi:hypothetical protein
MLVTTIILVVVSGLLMEVIGRLIVDDEPRTPKLWGWRKLLVKIVGLAGICAAQVGLWLPFDTSLRAEVQKLWELSAAGLERVAVWACISAISCLFVIAILHYEAWRRIPVARRADFHPWSR